MDDSQKTIGAWTRHPASAVWPDLTDDQYTALRDSIAKLGQLHEIIATTGGKIVDGWHRLIACAELGIEAKIDVRLLSKPSVAAIVLAAHEGRRHMTKLELARLHVETMLACGLEFAGEMGDPGEEIRTDLEGRVMIAAGGGG